MSHRIDVNRLPLNQVDHEQVRKSAVAWHEAQAALRDAQRAVGALDGGRQRAREADAEEAAQQRRAGKNGAARKHEQAYDKALDAAEHEQRVAQALVRQTREEYQRALVEHLADWRDDVEHEAAATDELWNAALSTLLALHEQRTKAHTRRRMLGATGDFPAGVLRFRPEQLADSVTGAKLELARLDDSGARWRQRAIARVDDVLVALQRADQAEEIPPMPTYAYADQIRKAFEHSETVDRGYSIEEGRGDRLGTVADRLHVDGVPVYMPTGRGDDR